jgi:TM2 domain-containing membrane protein YozV
MERRSGFLTFLSALIPGVGYMYLGLLMKGVQTLAIFLLIPPILRFIGFYDISHIFQVVFWCYTFFDTFSVARRLDRGEHVPDSEFIFPKYVNNGGFQGPKNISMSRNVWVVVAWGLIIIGVLALLNKFFYTSELFGLIKSYINMYFLPVVLVFTGIYILIKNK